MSDPLEAARPKHPPLRELVHSLLLTQAEHDFICAARSSDDQLLVWDRRDGTDRQYNIVQVGVMDDSGFLEQWFVDTCDPCEGVPLYRLEPQP